MAGPETNLSSCESTGEARTRLTRYNRMISSQAYYTEKGILTCPSRLSVCYEESVAEESAWGPITPRAPLGHASRVARPTRDS